jgi:biopolymer transport protein ExbB
MELLIHSIKLDWPVLFPIFICSILVVAVAINRFSFYKRNKRDVDQFIRRLQRELHRGNLEGAQNLSAQLGGIIGAVAEEGVRVLAEQKNDFASSFDITTSLASRKLEKHLSILGTIGAVAPFLGLFGTVVRILYTFQDLAMQGNQSAAVAMGIGSALIATAFGLGVAIVAVILFNSFQSVVRRYEDDFQLLKLLFLSFATDSAPQSAPQPQGKAYGGTPNQQYSGFPQEKNRI